MENVLKKGPVRGVDKVVNVFGVSKFCVGLDYQHLQAIIPPIGNGTPLRFGVV